MGLRPKLLLGLVLPLVAGWAGACLAQPAPPTCGPTDRECFDQNYSRMCSEKGATPESCGAWLHGVIEHDPTNADALLGLASFAQTNEERVALLRRVVAVAPSPWYLDSLARALSQAGDHRESAALLERAYQAAMQRAPGPYAWRFARDAVFEYEWAGSPRRAARLRAKFQHDLELDAKVAETAHAEVVEPARLNSVLGELCAELILRMLGGNHCLAGLQHVVDAADRASADSAKARLAKSASDTMFLAAQTGGDVLTLADPAWRERFESTLQRYFGSDSADRMRHTLTEITVE